MDLAARERENLRAAVGESLAAAGSGVLDAANPEEVLAASQRLEPINPSVEVGNVGSRSNLVGNLHLPFSPLCGRIWELNLPNQRSRALRLKILAEQEIGDMDGFDSLVISSSIIVVREGALNNGYISKNLPIFVSFADINRKTLPFSNIVRE